MRIAQVTIPDLNIKLIYFFNEIFILNLLFLNLRNF